MAKAAKKYTQSTVYEFIPNDNLKVEEVIELTKLIRVGIPGDVLDKASDNLKKHFFEVKK